MRVTPIFTSLDGAILCRRWTSKTSKEACTLYRGELEEEVEEEVE